MVDNFILLAMLFFIIVFIYFNKKKTTNGFELNTTNFIKGIMAIFVIMSHTYKKAYFLGPLAVAGFFFLSGFGIKYKYDNGKKIEVKKIFQMYIPFILVNVFYLFKNSHVSFKQMIISFVFPSIVTYSWYIFEIIIIYFLCYFVLMKNRKNNDIIISILLITMIIVMYILKLGSWWYVSTISFVIGYWGYIFKHIKLRVPILIPFGLMIGVAIYIVVNNLAGGNVFGIMLVVISFLISTCIFLFEKKYSISNKFINYVGKNSLTVYLFHPIVINYVKIESQTTKFICGLVGALILGFVYNKFIKMKLKRHE